MPVIEFQRLPPDIEDGETSTQGDFLTVSMRSSHGENPNYNATLAKWLGILHFTIAFCNIIDGIVVTAMYYCRVVLLGTFIWCGLPFYFLAGLLALMSRDKKTRTIRLYMMFSFLAMLVALVMMCFMLVSAISDYHMGYPFMYVGDLVAAKLKSANVTVPYWPPLLCLVSYILWRLMVAKGFTDSQTVHRVCFSFDIFGIILGFIEVFAALTGILMASDRNRRRSPDQPLGCQVMGDPL